VAGGRQRCWPARGTGADGRALAILLAFQHDTGHAHLDCDTMIANYAGLLKAMGRSMTAIDAAMVTLGRNAGLDQGSEAK